MATSKKSKVEGQVTRFMVVRDDEILRAGLKSEADATDFVNAEFGSEIENNEVDDVNIIEYVRLYNVVPAAVDVAVIDIDDFQV